MAIKRNQKIYVSVPASSGNLGPGFDVLGLALQLRNELWIRVIHPQPGPSKIKIEGEGKETLPASLQNLAVKALGRIFKKAGRKIPQLEILCRNRIPLARGLGSSAAAIVGGLVAGNRLLGNKFNQMQILELASQMEGHPDNVAPALLGGGRAAGKLGNKIVVHPWSVGGVSIVVAIPQFKLSTSQARKVLPKNVPLHAAVSNIGQVALMQGAFKKDKDILKYVFQDRLHEPYRMKLIPGFKQVKEAALRAGAWAVTLSGAGPTMLGFTSPGKTSQVGRAMVKAFAGKKVKAVSKTLKIDQKGAIVK